MPPTGLGPGLDPAAFYLPTIFSGVDNHARVAREEIFGPVIALIPFDSDEEAGRLANDSVYGLAAGVRSGDLARARDLGRRLRVGTVWINDWHVYDLRAPFGGDKQSGIGPESGSWGYQGYQQIKHMPRTPALDRRTHLHLALLGAAT